MPAIGIDRSAIAIDRDRRIIVGRGGRGVATMELMTPTRMPLRTASAVTFFYALGYPIGNMAVNAMTPMAVLVFRFGLAAVDPGRLGARSRGWHGRRVASSATSRSPAC